MEIDKLKKWLDLAQQYQSDSFWKNVFNANTTEDSFNTREKSIKNTQENVPNCDLYEDDHELVIEIEIPGLTKEDIQISINQQILTISGEFKSLQTKRKYYLKERANRKFNKELTLPFTILQKDITSELNKGILVIRVPFNREEINTIPIEFDYKILE